MNTELLADLLADALGCTDRWARGIAAVLAEHGLLADRRLARCELCRRVFAATPRGGMPQRFCSRTCADSAYRQTHLIERRAYQRARYARQREERRAA